MPDISTFQRIEALERERTLAEREHTAEGYARATEITKELTELRGPTSDPTRVNQAHRAASMSGIRRRLDAQVKGVVPLV